MRRLVIWFLVLLIVSTLSIFPPAGEGAAKTSAQTLYNEGLNFYNAQNYSSALDRFRKAADQGHAAALWD